MGEKGVDDAFDALNKRFDAELVDDEETKFADSMAALRSLAEDQPAGGSFPVDPDADEDADADDELGRVLAALKLEVDPDIEAAAPPLNTAGTKADTQKAPLKTLEPAREPAKSRAAQSQDRATEPKARATRPKAEEPAPQPAESRAQESDAARAELEAVQRAEPEPQPPPEPEPEVSELETPAAQAPEVSPEPEPEPEPEVSPEPEDQPAPEADLDLPPFLRDWTHSTDEHQILTELFPVDSVLSTDETSADSITTDETSADETSADEIPSFLSTGDQRIATIASSEPGAIPEDAEPAPIIPVGIAARVQSQPTQTLELPEHRALVETPTSPPSTSGPTRSSPPSPWIPRIAAAAGITMLIAGSAALWVSLLGSPRSGAAEEGTTTTAATVLPAVLANNDPLDLEPDPVERSTVTVTDDRLSAEITRCDSDGMSGEISASGADWVTTRIRASFVSVNGELLTAANPVDELVPTTIRVPFTFGYEPSLAPDGFENEVPWCQVTIDVVE